MHHPLAPRVGQKQVARSRHSSLSEYWVLHRHWAATSLYIALAVLAPALALAQASPFMTGATALQTNILAWLTPVAIILVMILGGMAMANRMSWGWCLGAILGIAIGFGAPQIVTWVRGMFGV